MKKSISELKFHKYKKGMHVANLNIQHLLPKLDEIKLILSQNHSSDILGLCETFLTPMISDNDLSIPNYSFERKDRLANKGGGILVYISNKLPYVRRSDLESNDLETLWIQINFKNSKPFLIGFIYRPPSSKQSWIDDFEKQLKAIDDGKTE